MGAGGAERRARALAQEITKVSGGAVRTFLYEPRLSRYVELLPNREGALFDGPVFSDADLSKLAIITPTVDRYVDNLHLLKRGETPVCALLFTRRVENADVILQLASYFVLLYDLRTNERMLYNLNEPLDFLHQDLFYEKLADLVCKSTGMDSGAYRSLQDGELRCQFTWQNGKVIDRALMDNWNLGVSDFRCFETCIANQAPVQCRNIQREHPEFSKRQEQAGIVSFCVVPVQVGQTTEGILSVAQRREYVFSETEVEGFKSIANAVGVAQANYRNFHQARHEALQRERALSAAATVEIAQGIRHEIIGSAGLIISNCSLAELNRDKEIAFREKINIIKSEAELISSAVKRMKQVMDFERNLEYASIEEIIDDAFVNLSHTLTEAKIDYNRQKNYSRERRLAKKYLLIPNLIRFILHNLILNSIESFVTSKKANREIMVEYERNEANHGVVLRYFDNGQGLSFGMVVARMLELTAQTSKRAAILRGEHGEERRKELVHEGIFEERVTTKSGGSGYGLYIARKMAEYHFGSVSIIEPQDKRWSIGFRIDFSTDPGKFLGKNNKVILRVARDDQKEAEKAIMDAMLAGCETQIIYPP